MRRRNRLKSGVAILVNDVHTISEFMEKIPGLLVSGVMIVACFPYMAFLSPVDWFFACFCCVSFSLSVSQNCGSKRLRTVRDSWDKIFDEFRAAVFGLKELYLNRRKRDAFMHDSLEPVAKQLLDSRTKARVYQLQMLQVVEFFIFLCLMLLAAGHSLYGGVDAKLLQKLTVIFLFMMPHFRAINRFTFFMPEASVALDRTEKLVAKHLSPEAEFRLLRRKATRWQADRYCTWRRSSINTRARNPMKALSLVRSLWTSSKEGRFCKGW